MIRIMNPSGSVVDITNIASFLLYLFNENILSLSWKDIYSLFKLFWIYNIREDDE